MALVALLAEGVDRNGLDEEKGLVVTVALLAEGVDRNPEEWGDIPLAFTSPSSRRAWIEICCMRRGRQ